MLVKLKSNPNIWTEQGQGGTTIRKTATALVFGIYDDPCTPGECNIAVEKLGEYIHDNNF